MKTASSMRALLGFAPERLKKLPEHQVESKSSYSAWSAKEELGHLLDSAANNHQRIVRAQVENGLKMPGYDQNRWVEINNYQQRDWKELIELWQALNRQLLAAAESVPDSAWSHNLTIGEGAPVTLQFVFDDYVRHMVHHLEHIGIEVNDLSPKTDNAA